jgi:hypothetical protein
LLNGVEKVGNLLRISAIQSFFVGMFAGFAVFAHFWQTATSLGLYQYGVSWKQIAHHSIGSPANLQPSGSSVTLIMFNWKI